MSFVEALGSMGTGVPDSAFIACVSGIVVVSLVAGVPAFATALRLLRANRGIAKYLARLWKRQTTRS
jgi:hypothetical protein